MRELSEYGKMIQSYRGTGVLVLQNEQEFACKFELVQIANGEIYVQCFLSAQHETFFMAIFLKSFTGQTDDECTVNLSNPQIVSVDGMGTGEGSTTNLILIGKEAKMISKSDQSAPWEIRFFLSNLETFETQEFTITIGDIKIKFCPLPSSKKLIRSLKASHSIDVTAMAKVANIVADQIQPISNLIDVFVPIAYSCTRFMGRVALLRGF